MQTLKRNQESDFNFIKLTMSQFCKTKRGLRHYQTNKIQSTLGQNKQQPFLLHFIEKQLFKTHINKCGSINYRNNKKSFLRPNKPSQINFGLTALGLKSSGRTQQQLKHEQDQHESITAKINLNSAGLNKENRPASMNEFKHRPLTKIKANFCNTQRYESIHNMVLQERPCQDFDQMKIKRPNLKNNKYKITKSQSRSHLSKFLIKDQKLLTEAEQMHNSDVRIQKMYKQSSNERLIEQRKETNHPKQKQQQNLKEDLQNKITSNFKTIIIKQADSETNQKGISTSRVEELFDVNFSTIKLRNESSSKFISQEAAQELIDPISISHIWNEQKAHCHKKRKLDIDKVRKKFPEHFFK